MEHSLKQLIQEIASKNNPKIVIGVVHSTEPLKVIQKDDIGIQLTEKSVMIPREYTVKTGDEIYLLTLNNNKKYFMLGRV